MSNLVVHKVKCHGQPAPGSQSGPRTATQEKFVCKLCNERFQRKAQLVSHEEDKHNIVKSQSFSSRSKQIRGRPDPAIRPSGMVIVDSLQYRLHRNIHYPLVNRPKLNPWLAVARPNPARTIGLFNLNMRTQARQGF